MIKATDLIKENNGKFEFKYRMENDTGSEQWEETSTNETLERACIGVAYELYIQKAGLTINTHVANLIASDYRDRVIKLEKGEALLKIIVKDIEDDIYFVEDVKIYISDFQFIGIDIELYDWYDLEHPFKKLGDGYSQSKAGRSRW